MEAVRKYSAVMITNTLPPPDEMYSALVARDSSYDGIFVTAVRTTGIFCRPSCPARKPHRENVEFFADSRQALVAGYRPCQRCKPLQPSGKTPDWLEGLLSAVEEDPSRKWTDSDLRARSLDSVRVRRWFRRHHGMTFQAYQRARRLGLALGRIRLGDEQVMVAYDHGFESLSGFRDAFDRILGDTPGRSRYKSTALMTRLLTPLGPVAAAATEEGICLLEFADRRMLETQIRRLRKHLKCAVLPGQNQHLEKLGEELTLYFQGDLREFSVPLIVAGSEFQCAAWEFLQQIPYGETRSYSEEARAMGRPGALRAVGSANGDNRIAIVIPCHRVIRSDGSISGYGGGVWRKQFLLELEKKYL